MGRGARRWSLVGGGAATDVAAVDESSGDDIRTRHWYFGPSTRTLYPARILGPGTG